MITLSYQIQIKATPQELWKYLWEPKHYTQWTSAFSPGCYYQTDHFAKGSKIHLLTPSGDGMYSILDELEENKVLVFKHLGEIKDFEELPIDQNTWTDAYERYTLHPDENGVTLMVEVDTAKEYIDAMNKLFPKALQELKKITEYEDNN